VSARAVNAAVIAGVLSLLAAPVGADEFKTVLGETNLRLQEGANELLAGNADEGVRLTLLGLEHANSVREQRTAKSNLCAGYALLEDYETALGYCNDVLEEDHRFWSAYSNRALIYIKLRRFAEAEADLIKGESISPNARTLRAVRRMYRDATNPVAPSIVIDDRRAAPDDTNDADSE
jgi:tetratricopeptide (TPR) repeat protein